MPAASPPMIMETAVGFRARAACGMPIIAPTAPPGNGGPAR
jgi:hypothetical protein